MVEQNWANRKAGAEEARTPVQVLEGRSFNADPKPVAGTLKPSVVSRDSLLSALLVIDCVYVCVCLKQRAINTKAYVRELLSILYSVI